MAGREGGEGRKKGETKAEGKKRVVWSRSRATGQHEAGWVMGFVEEEQEEERERQ